MPPHVLRMEYVDGGDLGSRLAKQPDVMLSQNQVLDWLIQVHAVHKVKARVLVMVGIMLKICSRARQPPIMAQSWQ